MCLSVFAILLPLLLTVQVPPLDVDALVKSVDDANPSAKAAAHRVRAAVAAASRARAFEEPWVAATVRQVPTDPRMWMMPRDAIASPMVMTQAGVMVPIWGKRDLKGQMADAMADMARADEKMARLALRRSARVAFWELWLVGEAARINVEAGETLAALEETVIAQYASGRPIHHAVLRVQAERETVKTEALELRQRRRALIALVNALRATPSAEVGAPQASFTKPWQPDAQLMVRQALVARPEILMSAARQREATAEESMAHRELIPDPMLMVMAEQQPFSIPPGMVPLPMTPMVGGGIQFSLPVLAPWRQLKDAEIAAHKGRAAVEDANAAAQQINADIETVLSRIQTLDEREHLIVESIEPRTREALDASMGAVAVGEATALEVLDARRQLQAIQLELANTRAERETAFADLETAVGGPVQRGTP